MPSSLRATSKGLAASCRRLLLLCWLLDAGGCCCLRSSTLEGAVLSRESRLRREVHIGGDRLRPTWLEASSEPEDSVSESTVGSLFTSL